MTKLNRATTHKMEKKLISLTAPQVEFLNSESERLGISFADVVRRLIDFGRELQRERAVGQVR